MELEDTTTLDIDPDVTPVTAYAFDYMAHLFTLKVQALRTAAHQVSALTPVAAQLLATALAEVIEVAQDFHRRLVSYQTNT